LTCGDGIGRGGTVLRALWLAVVMCALPAEVCAQAWLEDPAGPGPMDEIIVTARRIEESVQHIPMSVQVLSGGFLDDADLSRLFELQFNIPGLVVNNAGLWGAGFSMRGVPASVATHLNGVYLGRQNLAMARMFDLERIEVLKGPQGTLYGRNATGGSINLISRSPEDSFGAEIETAYGSFATARTQGHVNVPVRGAAVRLAFIASEGDGYIRNSVDDRRFAEEDFWGLRGSLSVELGDATRLELMAQHVRDDGASGELWTPHPGELVDPRDIRLATVTLENPYLVTEMDLVSLNLEYDFGGATIRTISGYAYSHVRNLDDCAGVPLLQGCVRGARPLRYEQWSQEVQLLLPGRGRVDGLLGASWLEADEAVNWHQFLPRINPNPITDAHETESETAAAVFGQATLRLSDAWSMTAGVRLSRETTRKSTVGTGVQDSPTPVSARQRSDDISWRYDLKYAPAQDLLLYGSIATGYQAGGFTRQLVNGEPDGFAPEYLSAFELGGKSQWMGRRLTLNAAAFYYDYEDLQVSTVTFRDDRLVSEVDNAARAKLYGFDAEGRFLVSDRLAVSGGLVWIPKREYVEFINAETGDTLSGNTLVRAPEWTVATAIAYELPLGGRGTLSGRLEYHYRSKLYYTKENNPDFAQGGFGLLNVHLQFQAASGKWYAFASGRNLTNEDYFHSVFLQSSPGYPDTYELGAGYRF
jgi:iron complex outermembrane recepter protein